ncbi:hypothetical protein B0F90DRAFT_922341 [Multifurca ochricompacta]|uniref:Uncharacterized protein n=1 Tax=Multifurca ochricompacta TaxID=376703 RepID=A0AAD4M0D8_9AGAM|nr:hypothetical protein B0F90DRAFT_922341 [Multifurca ochricompacta]
MPLTPSSPRLTIYRICLSYFQSHARNPHPFPLLQSLHPFLPRTYVASSTPCTNHAYRIFYAQPIPSKFLSSVVTLMQRATNLIKGSARTSQRTSYLRLSGLGFPPFRLMHGVYCEACPRCLISGIGTFMKGTHCSQLSPKVRARARHRTLVMNLLSFRSTPPFAPYLPVCRICRAMVCVVFFLSPHLLPRRNYMVREL